jgi:micrococcal nuclease
MEGRQKSILWLCAIIFVAFFIVAGVSIFKNVRFESIKDFAETSAPPTISGKYKVVEVHDGDTLTVSMNGVNERVRLIGIDTPETKHPTRPVECFGLEASQFTKQKLTGSYVTLMADSKNSNRDRYDRLLRYVYSDGEFINLAIIKNGYGFAYTPFEFEKLDEFLNAEQQAKDANVGLWGNCDVKLVSGVYQTVFR